MQRPVAVVPIIIVMLLMGLALTSCFDPVEQYQVTFDTQGGSSISPILVTQGMACTEPVQPVKTESMFGGWYRENNFQTEWDFTTDLVQSNMQLYAKWLSPKIVAPVQSHKDAEF